jgi:GDP-mannose 6-dehydrogenase
MKISIFGLGYVGCVSAACLADSGNTVIGVDVNGEKVKTINAALSPIVEPGLPDLIRKHVKSGDLCATTDVNFAIQNSDVTLICVGTPSLQNGALNLKYVRRVAEEIGSAMKEKAVYHVVVVRSTVLPGTTEDIVLPILEKCSEKQVGADFGLSFNPEFLREGSALEDFRSPPRTVIGEWDDHSGLIVQEMYSNVEAPLVRTEIRVAEMVKYVDNSFHALKVVFGNEIGNFCKAEGIDSHTVMEIFCLDTKLNLSPKYLKPGNAFGGSCLPKDVRALNYRMKQLDLSAPVLQSILPSNEAQKARTLQIIREQGKRKIGVMGLSFKANTDDLRESPTVQMVETLIGKGYQVRIFDPNVNLGGLIGSNRAFIEQRLPHIVSLLVNSLEEVLDEAEVVVITTRERAFRDLPSSLRKDQIVVDLVRDLNGRTGELEGRYHGSAW